MSTLAPPAAAEAIVPFEKEDPVGDLHEDY